MDNMQWCRNSDGKHSYPDIVTASIQAFIPIIRDDVLGPGSTDVAYRTAMELEIPRNRRRWGRIGWGQGSKDIRTMVQAAWQQVTKAPVKTGATK